MPSMPRRRQRSAFVATAAVILFAAFGAEAAAAPDSRADGSVPAIEAVGAAPTSQVLHLPGVTELVDYKRYGDWVSTLVEPLGPGTTEILIRPDTTATGPIDCSLTSRLAGAFATYSADEWNAGELVFPVPAEVLGPVGVNVYDLDCHEGYSEARWFREWRFPESAVASDRIVAEELPAALTYYDIDRRFWDEVEDISATVHRGDTVHAVGAPGSWLVTPAAAVVQGGSYVYLEGIDGDSLREARIYDLVVSADGSTLSFTIPTDLDPGFISDDSVLLYGWVNSSDPTAGTPRTGFSNWRTRIDIAPHETAVASATSLKLTSSFGVSTRSVTAVARVTVDGEPVVGGTVTFSVDGAVRSTVGVSAGGKAVVALPKLPRGVHVVVAAWSGTPAFTGSSSLPVRLRILL